MNEYSMGTVRVTLTHQILCKMFQIQKKKAKFFFITFITKMTFLIFIT
jgi:hypothetical protein